LDRGSTQECNTQRISFLATFLGQPVGWYRLDQGAGFIAATVGAVIVLFIWNRLGAHRVNF